MKATPIPERSRKLVRERERDLCALCAGPGSEWHHRRSRSVRDDNTHLAANGLWLCQKDHAWAHGHPFEARRKGVIVYRDANPLAQSVVTYYGEVFLDNEGGFTFANKVTSTIGGD